jgi:hypothetical protein
VTDAVRSVLTNPATADYSLIVTGHSIGAAIATLAAAELRSLGYYVDLYTFGSPRVGNAAFVDYVESQSPALGNNYRMTHLNDPVPQIPPTWIGYKHTSPEYWLSDGTATTDDYGVGDIEVCKGVGGEEPEECNAATGLLPLEAMAHNHYLGSIDACKGPIAW